VKGRVVVPSTGKRAVLLGFTFQYGITPLVALLFGYLFYVQGSGAHSSMESMDERVLRALGVVLVGVSPGGTTSQLFTSIARGDVALSISMTFFSTIAAFGAMPLLLFLYSEVLGYAAGVGSSLAVNIPYMNIFIALLLVVIPVSVGVTLRAKCGEKAARIAERFGTVCGVAGITLAVILGMIIWPEIPQSPSKAWAAGLLLTPSVCFLSYLLARMASLSHRASRTVSLEAGVQNSSLTIAVVSLSFSYPEDSLVIAFPLLYSVCLLFTALAVALIYRFLFPRLGLWDKEEVNADGSVERTEGTTVELGTAPLGVERAHLTQSAGTAGGRRTHSRHRSRRGTTGTARSPSPSSASPTLPAVEATQEPLPSSLTRSSSSRRRRSRRDTQGGNASVRRERKNTL